MYNIPIPNPILAPPPILTFNAFFISLTLNEIEISE